MILKIEKGYESSAKDEREMLIVRDAIAKNIMFLLQIQTDGAKCLNSQGFCIWDLVT